MGAQVLSPFQNHHIQGAAEIKPPFFVLCPSGFRPCVFAVGDGRYSLSMCSGMLNLLSISTSWQSFLYNEWHFFKENCSYRSHNFVRSIFHATRKWLRDKKIVLFWMFPLWEYVCAAPLQELWWPVLWQMYTRKNCTYCWARCWSGACMWSLPGRCL